MNIQQDLWGLLSIAVAAWSLIPYFTSIRAGKTRPHIFSWAIWTLLTAITFVVQVSQGAGPGAWSTGFVSVCCLFIVLISFGRGEKNITRIDWITFIAALAAIPIWLLTRNPALAAVWVTGIDGLGFYPTCRKSWHKPYEERIETHILSLVKHLLSLLALHTISIATALYPVALAVFNVVLIGIIGGRRRGIKNVI